MAGAKTRFGYLGSGGDEPPDVGDSGPARTVIGHDIHLPPIPSSPSPSGFAPAPTPIPPRPSQQTRAAMAPFARARVAAPMTEAVTEAIPERQIRRPQPSRLARFLGRWTTGGHFRSNNPFGGADLTDDELRLPRDTAARNVLLVLAIAALTFLITFAIMKWREPRTVAPAVEPPAHVAAPPATPMLPAAAPVPPPPAAAPSPAAPAAAVPMPSTGTKLPTPPQQPAESSRAVARPHKNSATAKAASLPPAHLRDELLPLNP